MTRAFSATCIALALVVPAAGRAEAGERTKMATMQYRGHSSEVECRSRLFDTGLLDEVNSLACGAANTAHAKVFSERTRFGAPWWARSVRISITDDAGLPVGFKVYFDDDPIDGYRFTNSNCVQRATLNLRTGTKRVSVARIAGGCGGSPTTGAVTASFSSSPTTNPSRRNYVAGCSLVGLPDLVGFDVGRCSYRASKAGGYIGAGTWSIDVIRGDKTIHVEAAEDPPCSPTGFIRAGDHVTVRLLVGYVSAGDDVHC